MPVSVHVAVLRRAAEMLGGRAALCAYLRVSRHELDTWLEGTVQPPRYAFLKAVDVVSAELGASGADPAGRAGRVSRQTDHVISASKAARERAEQARARAETNIRRSKELLAKLLETGRPSIAGRGRLSAAGFVATQFAPSEARPMIEAALGAAVDSTSAARGNIQLVSPEGLRIVTQIGFEKPFLDFFEVVERDTPSSCGPAHERAERIVVPQVSEHALFAGTPAAAVMEEAGARACQSTPLVSQSGEVIGMLSTHYETPHQPTPEELHVIDAIAQRASSWLDAGQAV